MRAASTQPGVPPPTITKSAEASAGPTGTGVPDPVKRGVQLRDLDGRNGCGRRAQHD